MRLVAIAYVLLSILMFSVTYPFLLAASETFHSEADLATFLGLLSAAVTATSFVVSIVLANRVYARFGVAGAALLLPLVYLAGFGLWLVTFSIATAAIVRFTQQVTQRGLSNAAWSAFYNVVPTERRAQVLAFNDGVPNQLGTILSGVLILAAGAFLVRDQVFWLGALTALVCTIVVLGIRRGYAASLLRTLRAGLGEQVLEGGPGLAVLTADPAVIAALVEALKAPAAEHPPDGRGPARPHIPRPDIGRWRRRGARGLPSTTIRTRPCASRRSRRSACSAAHRPRSPRPRRPCSTRMPASATPRSGRSAPWPTTRRWRRSPGYPRSPATRARPFAPPWPACSDRADRTPARSGSSPSCSRIPTARRAWLGSPPSAGCATRPRSTPPAPCSATHRPGSGSRSSRHWRHSPTVPIRCRPSWPPSTTTPPRSDARRRPRSPGSRRHPTA